MGGRGASLGRAGRRQVSPIPASPRATPDLQIFNRSTNSRTIEDSLTLANPKYQRGGDPAYTTNCQRCVFAYELLRRGYDVEARKALSHDPLSTASETLGWPSIIKGYNKEASLIKQNTKRKVQQEVEQRMLSYGDGARAIIGVQWSGRRHSGHAFIVENVGGKIKYVDPQSAESDVSKYMNYIKPTSTYGYNRYKMYNTRLVRIDNAEFTSNITKAVKIKGE